MKDLIFNGLEYECVTLDGVTSVTTIEDNPLSFDIIDIGKADPMPEFVTGDIPMRVDDVYAIVKYNGVTNVWCNGMVVGHDNTIEIVSDKGILDVDISSILDNNYIVYVQKIDTHARKCYSVVYITGIKENDIHASPVGGLLDEEVEVIINGYGKYEKNDHDGYVYSLETFTRHPLSLESAYETAVYNTRLEYSEYMYKKITQHTISSHDYEMVDALKDSLVNINSAIFGIYHNNEDAPQRVSAFTKEGFCILTRYASMDLGYTLHQVKNMMSTNKNHLVALLKAVNFDFNGWDDK